MKGQEKSAETKIAERIIKKYKLPTLIRHEAVLHKKVHDLLISNELVPAVVIVFMDNTAVYIEPVMKGPSRSVVLKVVTTPDEWYFRTLTFGINPQATIALAAFNDKVTEYRLK